MNRALSIRKLYGELVPVNQVVSLLAEETDVERVADFARAVEAAKNLNHHNSERQNYWAELAIWSTRRLGELIQEGQKRGAIAKKGRPKKKGHDVTFNLQQVLGTKTEEQARQVSQRARKLAKLPEKTVSEYVARQAELEDEISKAGLLRAAGADGTICTKHGNDVVDWYTPEKYIEAVHPVPGMHLLAGLDEGQDDIPQGLEDRCHASRRGKRRRWHRPSNRWPSP